MSNFIKVGIIGAMEEEIKLLRNRIKNFRVIPFKNSEIYIGRLYSADVVLLRSGIGKVPAAIGTTMLLEYYKPNLIINTGSAGSLVQTLKIGDIVISNAVCYHDVDVTTFGYNLGQLPSCPVIFKANKELISMTKECISELNLSSICGLIVSGDAFINNYLKFTEIRRNFPQAIAVDMESTAVAHVCHNFNIPFIVIRAISDIVCQQSDFNKFLTVSVKHSSMIVEALIKKLII